MHGIIYQISDSPIDRDDYIGVDTVSEGDMADFDYLYDTTEEERRKQIQYLVEHTLPKGMFTIDTDDETLVYQGGFAEWRKSYLDLSAIKPDYQAFIVSTPNFAPKNAKLGVFIYS